MHKPLTQLPPSLPRPPTVDTTLGMSLDLRKWLTKATENFDRDLVRSLEGALHDVYHAVRSVDEQGDDIEADTTLVLSERTHRVSGSATITTITAPKAFFGRVYLINIGSWSLGVGGNIVSALTPAPNQVVTLVFMATNKMWYVG